MAFALDAENSDHYRDDLDYIPAINAAMNWLTSVVNMALGQNKIGEEFFREIQYSGVFQTDEDSRISLDVFPNEVWTILAIYPLPQVKENRNVPPVVATDFTRSHFRRDMIHLSSDLDCKRLSVEEWARNKQNPFEAGYDGNQICGELTRYAYLNPINHWNTTIGLHSREIEIRPKLEHELATVFWAKKPMEIASLSDIVDFPSSTFQLLFNKALSYIAYKQGDGTTTYTVAEKDIQLLLATVMS